MPAVPKNLVIEQGATFVLSFTIYHEDPENPGQPGDPKDLTGAVARMQIRKTQQAQALVSATSDGVNPRIVLGGTTGTVVVTLSDEDTDLLTSKSALYDLEIEYPNVAPYYGRVDRILKGSVTVDPNITQMPEDPVVGP